MPRTSGKAKSAEGVADAATKQLTLQESVPGVWFSAVSITPTKKHAEGPVIEWQRLKPVARVNLIQTGPGGETNP